MCRKKFKDNKLFDWTDVSHIIYIAALYDQSQEIYDKVKSWGLKGLLEDMTNHDVYTLIHAEFGVSVPD